MFIIVNPVLFSSHSKPTIDVAKVLTAELSRGTMMARKSPELSIGASALRNNPKQKNNVLPLFGSNGSSVGTVNKLQAGRAGS